MAISELVKQPGQRSNGLSRIDALRVGALVAWTMWAAAGKEPHRRRLSQLAVPAIALSAVLLTWTSGRDAAAMLLAAILAVAGLVVASALLIVIIEAESARRADRVWIIQTGAGRAYGRVTEMPDGTWELSSMSAWPFKGTTGSLLLHQVCRTADRLEVPGVRLIAATSALAVRYYRPAGFTDVGRTHLGLPKMKRPLARNSG